MDFDEGRSVSGDDFELSSEEENNSDPLNDIDVIFNEGVYICLMYLWLFV